MAKKGDFKLGFNGHAWSCVCEKCTRSKLDAFDDLDPRLRIEPKDVAATVLVRAHYRYHPRHMKGAPKSRKLLRRLLSKRR
jgi:hypothetical protein